MFPTVNEITNMKLISVLKEYRQETKSLKKYFYKKISIKPPSQYYVMPFSFLSFFGYFSCKHHVYMARNRDSILVV